MNTLLPTVDNSLLLVIDVQEKLMPVIHEQQKIIQNIQTLMQGAMVLGLDMLLTEQYPKGLGHTIPELSYTTNTPVFEKECFSCLLQANVKTHVEQAGKKHLILCGVESHICVLKTALDAVAQGYTVHVVADAVSSRTPENKALALERMRQAGVFIVSLEMMLFMLIDRAGTAEFKAISKLIK